jgi:monoamine oxidase
MKFQVNTIDYSSEDKIKVITASGKVFKADKVVVTVPLKVLQSNVITFKPDLPGFKVHAINNLGVGIVEKVCM